MSDDTQRVIGAHDAKLDNHDDRITRIEEKVDRLLAYQQQAKGGYRMLIAVGTLAGGVGAVATKVLAGLMKGVP